MGQRWGGFDVQAAKTSSDGYLMGRLRYNKSKSKSLHFKYTFKWNQNKVKIILKSTQIARCNIIYIVYMT